MEILNHMRDGSSLSNHKDLLAYWKFDDPDQLVSSSAMCDAFRLTVI